jgi:hypothetical protein
MTKPGSSTIDAMDELAQVAAPTDPQTWQWGLLTLEFFLYAVREPTLQRELAERFQVTRRRLAASLEPHLHSPGEPPLTSIELAIVAMAVSTGLGVQAVLEPPAIPPDLYARMMTRLLG